MNRDDAAPVLQTRDLSVAFGGVHALRGVSLKVLTGAIVGLIGPNGAGKTTLIDALTGYVRSSGTVELDGCDVSQLSTHQRARRGIIRTWQSVELFDEMTVREQLLLAANPRRPAGILLDLMLPGRSSAWATREVDSLIQYLGITDLGGRRPDELSHGDRKIAGVARALAAKARVLLIDEPAAGLNNHDSRRLGSVLRRVADDGQPMLLIEHDMDLVLGVCDYVYVLDAGLLIAHGTPREIRENARVVEAYLGVAPDAPP